MNVVDRPERPLFEVDRLAAEIGRQLREHGELAKQEVASKVGRSASDGTLKRALTKAVEEGVACKQGHGRYGPPEGSKENGGTADGEGPSWAEERSPEEAT